MTTSTSTNTSGVSIALSREELYMVMRLIKATSIPGYDLGWTRANEDGTLPEETQRALEVATTALMARGYLVAAPSTTPGQKLLVDVPSPVLALVGACAFGAYSILLLLRQNEERQLVYLHELRNLGVAHTLPLVDVHKFEALAGRDGVIQKIDRALGLGEQPRLGLPDGTASVSALEAARDAALAGDFAKAAEILTKAGVPAQTAAALCTAMQRATALGSITIARRTEEGQMRQEALALVVAPEICFSLLPHQGMYQIRDVSAAGIRFWIRSCLAEHGQQTGAGGGPSGHLFHL